MLTVNLTGFKRLDGKFALLSYAPSGAGCLPGGGFDDEAWDAAQTHLVTDPGADIRATFREAYRLARIEARKHGGLEFLPTTCDEDPCPLPDLPRTEHFGSPAVVMLDNGTAFISANI